MDNGAYEKRTGDRSIFLEASGTRLLATYVQPNGLCMVIVFLVFAIIILVYEYLRVMITTDILRQKLNNLCSSMDEVNFSILLVSNKIWPLCIASYLYIYNNINYQ